MTELNLNLCDLSVKDKSLDNLLMILSELSITYFPIKQEELVIGIKLSSKIADHLYFSPKIISEFKEIMRLDVFNYTEITKEKYLKLLSDIFWCNWVSESPELKENQIVIYTQEFEYLVRL